MTNGDGTFCMNKWELRSKTVFKNERKFKRNEYTLLFSQFELNGTLRITSFQHEKAAREKYRSADWKLRLYRHFKNKIISKVYIYYTEDIEMSACINQFISNCAKFRNYSYFDFSWYCLYTCKCCRKNLELEFLFLLYVFLLSFRKTCKKF